CCAELVSSIPPAELMNSTIDDYRSAAISQRVIIQQFGRIATWDALLVRQQLQARCPPRRRQGTLSNHGRGQCNSAVAKHGLDCLFLNDQTSSPRRHSALPFRRRGSPPTR